MRIQPCLEFLQPFVEDDPSIVGLVVDTILKVDRVKDAIQLLA